MVNVYSYLPSDICLTDSVIILYRKVKEKKKFNASKRKKRGKNQKEKVDYQKKKENINGKENKSGRLNSIKPKWLKRQRKRSQILPF